jgi:hypothetical protein
MTTTATRPTHPPIIDPDPGRWLKRLGRPTGHAPEPGAKVSRHSLAEALDARRVAGGVDEAMRGALLAAKLASLAGQLRPHHTSWLPER